MGNVANDRLGQPAAYVRLVSHVGYVAYVGDVAYDRCKNFGGRLNGGLTRSGGRPSHQGQAREDQDDPTFTRATGLAEDEDGGQVMRLPAPFQELPDGWEFARDRPHSLVEVEKHLSPTKIHILVGRDRSEVIAKIEAAEGQADQA